MKRVEAAVGESCQAQCLTVVTKLWGTIWVVLHCDILNMLLSESLMDR